MIQRNDKLEDRVVEITKAKKKKINLKKMSTSLREILYNNKLKTFALQGSQEGEVRKGQRKYLKK